MGTGGDPRGWAGRTRRWWEGPSPCAEQARQAKQRGGGDDDVRCHSVLVSLLLSLLRLLLSVQASQAWRGEVSEGICIRVEYEVKCC